MFLPVDTWAIQQYIGLFVTIFALAFLARKRLSWFVLTCFVYYCFQGIVTGMTLTVLQACLFFILLLAVPRRWVKYIYYSLVWLFCLDAIWFGIAHFTDKQFGGNFGLMNASSFDTSIMAILLPGLVLSNKWEDWKWIPLSILTACIVLTQGRTGLMAGYITLLIYYWHKPEMRKTFWGLVALIPIVLLLGWSHITNDHGRLDIYLEHFKWWSEHANRWLGTGFGSFDMIGPTIPVPLTGQPETIVGYRFMHSDFLEMIFETGLIGGTLFLGLYGYVIWRSRVSPMTLAFTLSFLIASLTYFPLRFFFSQLIAFCILKFIFDRSSNVRMRELRKEV